MNKPQKQKMRSFIVKHQETLQFIRWGIIAGVIPSVLNHLGEFIKWGFVAKTADQYGFWVIFVTLIILKSKSRKYAILNSVLFCITMVVIYGLVETLFKVPFFLLQPIRFLSLFFEYEFAQAYWLVMIVLLVPVSWMIYSGAYTSNRNRVKSILFKIVASLLVILPLLNAVMVLIKQMSQPQIVCAEITNWWKPGLCLWQQPDEWIIANLVIEGAIYTVFAVFWTWFLWWGAAHKYIRTSAQ